MMIRSILGVVAGFVVTLIASFATDAVLMAFPDLVPPNQPPSTPILVIILGYLTVYATLGGFVAASIAGRGEFWHGLALGIVFSSIGTISLVLMQSLAAFVPEAADAGPPQPPLWYQILCIVLALPAAAFGAYLRSWWKRSRLTVTGQTA
jgi:putative membrane protein (TIGR04086 family)